MNKEFDIYNDAWMFLLGGSNQVADYWVDKKIIPDNIKSAWNTLLKDRYALAQEIGFDYVHVVAPEKLSIYPEKTELEISDDYIPSTQIERCLDDDVKSSVWLNAIPFLRTQKENYQLYAKTDTHWNFLGAYCAYQLIQSKLGRSTNPSVLQNQHEGHWTVMDLGGKFDPPLKEQVYFYEISENVSRVYANELVKLKESSNRLNDIGLHIGSHVIYNNSNPIVDEVLMLFGDSFSEYRGHLLTGLFAETYREVHFVWSGSLDVELIRQVKPDVVVSELAERFMSTMVPHNKFNLEEFCQELLGDLEAA